MTASRSATTTLGTTRAVVGCAAGGITSSSRGGGRHNTLRRRIAGAKLVTTSMRSLWDCRTTRGAVPMLERTAPAGRWKISITATINGTRRAKALLGDAISELRVLVLERVGPTVILHETHPRILELGGPCCSLRSSPMKTRSSCLAARALSLGSLAATIPRGRPSGLQRIGYELQTSTRLGGFWR